MAEPDIDLDRAIADPVYRRRVIERLKAEAGADGPPGVTQIYQGELEPPPAPEAKSA